MAEIDALPGYRRQIRVMAGSGAVLAQLEDDIHCMSVTLDHEGGIVTAVHPVMHRAPWTTCPGAVARLIETFTGLPLADVTARREKAVNCTHLHDLAVLAAAHADDRGSDVRSRGGGAMIYDILVSDPANGTRILEIRRDGTPLMRWIEHDGLLTEPAGVAGASLLALRDWIAGLPLAMREPARLLQWAGLVAHCRTLPLARISHAQAMPPSCYTFQPERVAAAQWRADARDFSTGMARPLDRDGQAERDAVLARPG